jgi:hypothetical protein
VVSQLCMLLSSNHSKKWCGCVTSKDSLVVKPEGTASLIPKPCSWLFLCRNAPEDCSILSQNDTSQNSVPEPFFPSISITSPLAKQTLGHSLHSGTFFFFC